MVDERGARAVFDSIDVNASGRVSAEELAAALHSAMSLVVEVALMEEIIKQGKDRFVLTSASIRTQPQA